MILQIASNTTAELAHNFIDLTTACFIVISVMSGVIAYLYKRLESKNDLFINELRASNEKLTGMITSYNKFLDKMDRIIEVMADKK